MCVRYVPLMKVWNDFSSSFVLTNQTKNQLSSPFFMLVLTCKKRLFSEGHAETSARRTPHYFDRRGKEEEEIIIMEKEHHHIHDDDEEEICDQRKSRTARQALEEVRIIILHDM